MRNMWYNNESNFCKVNIFENCIEYFEIEITKQKDIKKAKKLITKLIFKYWKNDEAKLFGDADTLHDYLNINYLNNENENIDIDMLKYWIKKFKKSAQKDLERKIPCLKADIDRYWRYFDIYEPKDRAIQRLNEARWNIDKMNRYINGYWSDSWAYNDKTPMWEYDDIIKQQFAIDEN